VLASPERTFFGRVTTASLISVLIAAATLMVGSAACSSSPNDNPATMEIHDERVSVTQLRGVVEALCEANDEAARDPEAARRIFFDRAHDALHDIATAAQEVDRSSAARLLEAKHAVETDLEAMGAPELASDLGRLIAAS